MTGKNLVSQILGHGCRRVVSARIILGAVLLVAGVVFSDIRVASANTYTVRLSPANNLPVNYVGRGGFFSSNNWNSHYDKAPYNFTFLHDMTMEINGTTGNATVTGTMRNNANSNDLWSFNLELTGLVVKDLNGQFFGGRTSFYDGIIEDILKIPSAHTNQQYGVNGYGIEWQHSNLTITDLNPGSAFPGPTVYVGKNDPSWFHFNVAELHNWQGNLYFGAWYMATNHPSWIADTKAWGHYTPPSKPPVIDPIPEPATVALLGLGLAGVAARRKKKVAV
ncbi:MAG TPA: PEP-CTERM sorting domain-containing protein [Oligoflexia bacterium]|nr:PEP-CTERM sorting domain-containing protein [Oligoflexia bacterium]HMP47261.1 PEP-CTERM sorting domain-containing protein [Oligoflexia bacterium]